MTSRRRLNTYTCKGIKPIQIAGIFEKTAERCHHTRRSLPTTVTPEWPIGIERDFAKPRAGWQSKNNFQPDEILLRVIGRPRWIIGDKHAPLPRSGERRGAKFR
jgi:hypothetical protein